jgi:hypothetical protein
MPGQCMYLTLLADSELQAIGQTALAVALAEVDTGSEYEWNRKLGWALLRIPLVRIVQRTQLTSSHSL